MDIALVGTEPSTTHWLSDALAQSRSHVAGAWDADAQRGRALAEAFQCPVWTEATDPLTAMRDSKIDAVVIGDLARDRTWAEAALERRIPVWVVGALAPTVVDAKRLLEVASRRSVALGCGPTLRQHEVGAGLHRAVAGGQIGQPVLVDWEDIDSPTPSRWGIQAGVDLMIWLVGHPAETVYAQARSVQGREYIHVHVRFVGGAMGGCAITRSQASSVQAYQTVTVMGTKGQLSFDSRLQGLLRVAGDGIRIVTDGLERGFASELAMWLGSSAVRESDTSAQQALATLAVTAAAEASLGAGSVVEVEEVGN